jgi:thiol-disulfide isomerase/thioredoxin
MLFVGLAVALAAAYCRPARAQMVMPHTEYNDLVVKMNMAGETLFATEESRKQGAGSFLATMNRFAQVIRDETKSHPMMAENYNAMLHFFDIYRLALDDPAALEAYNTAQVAGGAAAAEASINRAAADWLDASDAAAQGAALDKLRAAIAADGQPVPFSFWSHLLQYKKPLSDSVGTPLLAYLKQYAAEPVAAFALPPLERANRQMYLTGKPVTLETTLVSGEHISTAQWKGKVVYIDLWATWCAPCVAALPDVQAMYAAHHAEGLEVLGISCDESAQPLKAFLARRPDLTFPQAYDPAHHNFEKDISLRLGVQSLSVSMIIDRQGIMHYPMKQGLSMEDAVRKYLAETP